MNNQSVFLNEENLVVIKKLIKFSNIHYNISQELIVTTEDKIRLYLSEHIKYMDKKRGFVAPLSIFITISMVFLTSSFHDFFLNAETWNSIFIIADIFAFVWLMLSIKEALKSQNIEDLIKKLKND